MVKRENIRALLIPLLAVAAGLLVGVIFILMSGGDPALAYGAFYKSVFGSWRNFGFTLTQTTPLIFTGLAISLAFRCGLFNIGVEGQYLVGMLATAVAGYSINLPPVLHTAVALAAGAAAAALWAGLVGVLKAYRGVHEVINSIMLNYIALFLTNYLLLNYLKVPGGSSSKAVNATAALSPGLIEGSNLHTGLFIALAAAVVVWLFLWKTPAGYEIRSVGLSPGAAEYGGINVATKTVMAMALSGVLAGLAGGVQVLGVTGRFFEQMGFVGYGFDGIAVALVGRNHPFGVVLSALLFGALTRGGPSMQAVAQVPKEIIWIVQGTIIFFVAAEGLWTYLQTTRKPKGVKL